MKSCVIVGAGTLYHPIPRPAPDCLVIAADGGYTHLLKSGIRADVVVGDFDSLPKRPEAVSLIELPVEKDDTDMRAAMRYGLEQGCRIFQVYGGTGGRTDHTLANLQCLAYLAAQGARGYLYGEHTLASCIRDGSMAVRGPSGTVSVFAHSDTAEGVYLEGFRYGLRDAVLRSDYPLGVSNEFLGGTGRITVKKGTLLVLLPLTIDFLG